MCVRLSLCVRVCGSTCVCVRVLVGVSVGVGVFLLLWERERESCKNAQAKRREGNGKEVHHPFLERNESKHAGP